MAQSYPKKIPPMRPAPDQPDSAADGDRLAFIKQLWDGQDALVAARNRQVEENVRMVCGQQWMFYAPERGRFMHVSEFMTADEALWRQLPVVNLILPWFMLTHSRLTENPPIVGFQPSTSDDLDASLAETWDVIHKSQWREQGMEEVHNRLAMWLVCGGRAYMKSRVDPSGGEMVPLAPGRFTIPDGIAPEDFPVPQAREGGLVTDVLSSPEVRSEWGPKPFHEKAWHLHRSLLPQSQVEELWGITVPPDVAKGDTDEDLSQLLFGAGYYGAVDRPGMLTGATLDDDEGLCVVDELMMAPCAFPGMEETEDSPGGRWMLRVGENLVLDAQRPARFHWTSSIRAFDFVGLPGRPEGSSPQEMLNPIQRSYNRLFGQIMEHANLMTNPTKLVHQSVGIEDWSNEPGQEIEANWMPGISAPVQFLTPPPLGGDVYKALDLLEQKFDLLGSMRGSEPATPQPGISGESVKELRYNADRPLSSTAKAMAFEYARWSFDVMEWLKVLWTEERIIEYAGEDEILKTVTVMPDLWRGKIDVFADTESMLPEGKGERQARVEKLYAMGMFGDPLDPRARRRFLELARFPHLGRDVEAFASDRRTAKQAIAGVVQGLPAENVPLFRWYRFDIWMTELREYLSAPEYLKLDPGPQEQLALLWELLTQATIAQMMEMAPPDAGAPQPMNAPPTAMAGAEPAGPALTP